MLIRCPRAHSCLAAIWDRTFRSPDPQPALSARQLAAFSCTTSPAFWWLFFFFFSFAGRLTQISCKQTQLESTLACHIEQSACTRVYGREIRAPTLNLLIFSQCRDVEFIRFHPCNARIRARIVCKCILQLLLMVRCHRRFLQALQNILLAYFGCRDIQLIALYKICF